MFHRNLHHTSPLLRGVYALFVLLFMAGLAGAPQAGGQAAPFADPLTPDAPQAGTVYYVTPGTVAGLVGYWPLDKTPATIANDASGAGNHGTGMGNITISGAAPTQFPNHYGRSLDGASDYISVPDAASLDLSDQMTLSVWVYLKTHATQYILSKAPFPNNSGYALGSTSGQLLGQAWDSSGTAFTIQGGTILTNTWTHLAATFQRNGQITGYVNGVPVGNIAAGANAIGTNDIPLVIGAAAWATNSYGVNGFVDEARVYNRVLSATEIARLAAGKCEQSGTSWAEAFTNPRCGLAAASPGDEVWVQAGTYKPSADGDFALSFNMKPGVGLYGGFAGSETARSQRNWGLNLTTLSGDVNGNDGVNFANRSDNTLHVVYGNNITSTAVLDGFTILGGAARSYILPDDDSGGGAFFQNSNPTLANLVFTDNLANAGGGGLRIQGTTANPPLLSNLSFARNKANYGGGFSNYYIPLTQVDGATFIENQAFYGGGMASYNSNSSGPRLNRVLFQGNSASLAGGGLYLATSPIVLANSAFSGNHAADGGAIYSSESFFVLANSSLSGNTATNNGGAVYNVNPQPQFANPSPMIANSIVWGNTPGGSQIYGVSTEFSYRVSLIPFSCPNVNYCSGTILNTDPLFVRNPSDGGDGWGSGNNDDYGDLRLRLNSPAIDIADSDFDTDFFASGVQRVTTPDLRVRPRFLDIPSIGNAGLGLYNYLDMGGFEAQQEIYLPVVLRYP